MQHEIVCTCGACGHQTIAECRKDPCGTSHEMRGQLAAMIDQDMNHDQIIQAFIAKYGSEEMLGAPIDSGFSRLAWLFPVCGRRDQRGGDRLRGDEVVAEARAATADGRAARRRARRTHRR